MGKERRGRARKEGGIEVNKKGVGWCKRGGRRDNRGEKEGGIGGANSRWGGGKEVGGGRSREEGVASA